MADRAHPSPPAATDRQGIAIGSSIAILVTAFLVALKSGHDQSLGPLDLETAQRLAVVLWLVGPIAGGFVVRRSSTETLARVAVSIGIIVGAAVAFFPSSGTGGYVCSISLPAGPISYLLGRLAIGAIIGGGMAIAVLVTGMATRRLATVLPGLAIAGAANYFASTAGSALFYEAVRCL